MPDINSLHPSGYGCLCLGSQVYIPCFRWLLILQIKIMSHIMIHEAMMESEIC